MIKLYLGILVCLSASSMAEKAVTTYEFPKDTCSSEAYTIDQFTNFHLTFNGDFGSPDCRMFKLKVPNNPFYFNMICWHKWYYESPKCQSGLKVKFSYNEREFAGEGCHNQNLDFDDCIQADDSDLFTFYLIKNHEETPSRFNNEWYDHNTEDKNRPQTPDRVNDTFMIEIYVSYTYNYDMIGGLSGGLVGLVIIIVVVIVIVRCLRRRKRATGIYCCSTYPRLNAGDLKLSDGLSNECSCFGFTFWACIICRRRETSGRYHRLTADIGEEAGCSTEFENKLENVSGLQDPESLPPVEYCISFMIPHLRGLHSSLYEGRNLS